MPTLSRSDAAHLLRRVGFGGSAAEITALTGLERAVAVERVLDTSANPPTTDTPGGHTQPEREGENEYELWRDMSQYWLDRMATVPAPVQEKMTLFWHGHFVSEQDKLYDARRLWRQNQTQRSLALGDFEALAQAMAIDPAMLAYLDNAYNVKGQPQENFARELMELFTLGVDQGYTQADVVEVARAWTGHGLVDPGTDAGRAYRFRAERHDAGSKTIFGITRAWDGPEVISEICRGARRDTMARFIARKVWAFLAHPEPSAALVGRLATAFVAANLEIKALVRAVVLEDEFWSAAARNGLVRSPMEYAVAVLRSTGRRATEVNPQWYLDGMGQDPFNPPNVSGWRPNGYWLSTSALSARASFARHVAGAVWQRPDFALNRSLVEDRARSDDAVVQAGFDAFGITDPTPATRRTLVTWLGPRRREWYATVNLITGLLSSPDFNLA